MITIDKQALLELAEAGRTIGADDLFVAVEDGGYSAVLTTKDNKMVAFKNKPACLKANWSRIDFPFISKAASKPSVISVDINDSSATAVFEGSKAKTAVVAHGVIPDFGFDQFASLTYNKAPVVSTRSLMQGVLTDTSKPDDILLNVHLTDQFAEVTNRKVMLRTSFEKQEGVGETVMSPELAKTILSGLSYAVLSLPDKRTGNVNPVAIAVKLDSGWNCLFSQQQKQYPALGGIYNQWMLRPAEATVYVESVLKLLNDLVIDPTRVIFKTGKAVFQSDKSEDIQECTFNIDIADKEFAFGVDYLDVFLKHCVCCKETTFALMESAPDKDGVTSVAAFFNSPTGIGLMSGLRLIAKK